MLISVGILRAIRAAKVETPSDSESARLVVVEGDRPGREFELTDSALIGRSPDAVVRFDDAGVSRHHARISRSDSGPSHAHHRRDGALQR